MRNVIYINETGLSFNFFTFLILCKIFQNQNSTIVLFSLPLVIPIFENNKKYSFLSEWKLHRRRERIISASVHNKKIIQSLPRLQFPRKNRKFASAQPSSQSIHHPRQALMRITSRFLFVSSQLVCGADGPAAMDAVWKVGNIQTSRLIAYIGCVAIAFLVCAEKDGFAQVW